MRKEEYSNNLKEKLSSLSIPGKISRFPEEFSCSPETGLFKLSPPFCILCLGIKTDYFIGNKHLGLKHTSILGVLNLKYWNQVPLKYTTFNIIIYSKDMCICNLCYSRKYPHLPYRKTSKAKALNTKGTDIFQTTYYMGK